MRVLTLTTMETTGAESSQLRFPAVAGFFFVSRVGLTFLFFQANPIAATVMTVLMDIALVYCALLWSAGAEQIVDAELLRIAPVRWMLALLAFSLVSVLWTGAQSVVAALAYWTGMAADVTIVLLVLRQGDAQRTAESLMRGAAWGATALALIGWCSPLTKDLRLGSDFFLHPNTLGLEIGLGTLMAQYLARHGALWKWLGVCLAITLLRTLSKTAIVAYIAAECWYMLQSRRLTRAGKARIAVAALLILACFWGVLSAYLDAYVTAGSGNQLETLTGRTVLWTVTATMGLERPWFGHGLYSFKSLIPALGDFEPVHAHNELLQQFFEYGIVGAAIVVGIYASFLRLARRAESTELKTLAIALWIFGVVRGLADAVPVELCYPLWLMAAMAVCLTRDEVRLA
jgi:O-antigen ligase